MNIGHLDLTPREYDAFIRSPFADERIAGADGISVLVVHGGPQDIQPPGSLPIVVCALGDRFGASGPTHADLILSEKELTGALEVIERTPRAAATLALLLRSLTAVNVEDGLAMESAAYSLLQAGPEFAAWRAATSTRADASTRPVVNVARDDDELTITLDRPQRHNAITAQLRDELYAALCLAIVDDSISSIHLRGSGPSFCSGGDLDEFGSRPDPVTAHITRLARSPARLINQLRHRVAAHIHGSTLGGGIEMAAFAGFVEAHPDTLIGLPEIELGLIPGAGGTVSLTRRIGRQRTAALALTGHRIDAHVALEWGLVDRLTDQI